MPASRAYGRPSSSSTCSSSTCAASRRAFTLAAQGSGCRAPHKDFLFVPAMHAPGSAGPPAVFGAASGSLLFARSLGYTILAHHGLHIPRCSSRAPWA
eukprot:478152-Alexandrium_andersonii.AAC.1